MALPIRPTPVLSGTDAVRFERYISKSEKQQEPIKHFVFDKGILQGIVKAVRAHKQSSILFA